MSLIQCPECGGKISDQARSCIHCGYVGENPDIPISQQAQFESTPCFQYDIEEATSEEYLVIAPEDNRLIYSLFGSWERIQTMFPSIATLIQARAEAEPVLVAKMDDYVKKLIAEGIYRFSIDKNGEILPTIRDSHQIVKQVRLNEVSFAPQMSQALNNVVMQATMSQILEEIVNVEESIRDIQMELQDDRVAMAESAYDKLEQSKTIQDTTLRTAMIVAAISSATDAKHTLMRNYERNTASVSQHSVKSTLRMAIDFRGEKAISQKAQAAFQDLMCMVKAVQVECVGYSLLGEYNTSKKCLIAFRKYIIEKGLNQRDTLLLLNENIEGNLNKVVDDLSKVADRIEKYDHQYLIEYTGKPLVETEAYNG